MITFTGDSPYSFIFAEQFLAPILRHVGKRAGKATQVNASNVMLLKCEACGAVCSTVRSAVCSAVCIAVCSAYCTALCSALCSAVCSTVCSAQYREYRL